ncbi:MAG: DUF2723 domain-containing protein [Planctomycetes bacterium]|nr:DUF2723 domain-containing protein [Planctomycetota bacterium]
MGRRQRNSEPGKGLEPGRAPRSPALAVIVAVASGVIFLFTLAPTVTAEDSGELITAAWVFGIPHPPGYPLWTMLCGAFLHAFGFGSVAWRANLFSALCGSAAAVVAYVAVREALVVCRSQLTRPPSFVEPAAAASAALIWALSRTFWSQSVITEVYALNALLTAGMLWFVMRWQASQAPRWLAGAALLLGLGLGNHHTIALAGAAVGAWVLIQQPRLVRRGRLMLAGAAAFALGLLPYLYLPVRAAADPPLNWGNPRTLGLFWKHVTRSQYGAAGPMAVASARSPARLGSQLCYLGESITDDLTPWAVGAAGLGMVVLWRRARALVLLVALWVISTGVVFALLGNYDLDRVSQWVMRVFFIPVSLILALPIAALLGAVAEGCVTRLRRAPMAGGAALAAIMLAGPVVQVAAHWRSCDYSNYWYAFDHAENELRCMSPDAMYFPSGDHNTFPLVYAVMVEGRRPDVLIADIAGYLRPELYADRPVDSEVDPEAWLLGRARRPAFYTTKKAPPVAGARFVTAGILYHLLPEGMPFEGRALLARCAYRNLEQPSVIDLGAAHILADFHFFAGLHTLEGGDAAAARRRFADTAEVGWGIKEVFNNIGSALGEHGQEDAALPYFTEAARLDPHYIVPRWNLFRLHQNRQAWGEARRQLEELIAANPGDARAWGELGFLLSYHLHDAEGAVRAWQESLHREPDQPEVIEALHTHYRNLPTGSPH